MSKSFTNLRHLNLPPDYSWPTVTTVLSDRDEMLYDGDLTHYLSVGTSAMKNINSALALQGLASASKILDMPCGHGRVTRVLRAAFPLAEIVVSDLDEDAVAFCSENFGAKPRASAAVFSELDFGESFDLIWVGSLVTHLPPDAATNFFRFVARHLTSNGVAVISSHGPFVAGRIQASVEQGGEGYGTENGAARLVLSQYFRDGFGYADYPNIDASVQHYGISLATREWVTATVQICGCKVLFYRDHAWDGHHDIVAFARSA